MSHCDVCKWYERCDNQRRADDHLSFVAGLNGTTRKQLFSVGIKTLEALAREKESFVDRVKDANKDLLLRVKEQARMQLLARTTGKSSFEMLAIEKSRGLNRLPSPSEGDIFFDLEGDRYYRETGLEVFVGIQLFREGSTLLLIFLGL